MRATATTIETTTGDPTDRALRRLQFGLRFVGVGWTLFFSAVLLNELAGSALWDRDSWFGPLVMWGHGGHEYLVMLCTINIPLGLFLTAAANAPTSHRMFIDFAISANIVHLGGMLVMALVMPAQHINLAGDVPAGLLPNLALAVLWLPVRARSKGASRALLETSRS